MIVSKLWRGLRHEMKQHTSCNKSDCEYISTKSFLIKFLVLFILFNLLYINSKENSRENHIFCIFVMKSNYIQTV